MRKLILAMLAGAVVTSACKKDEEPEFDRKAMLENMASNVIIPYYQELSASLITLHTRAQEFTANPTQATLDELQAQYLSTNHDYQNCSMYNFGPALTHGIKGAFNTFPTDTSKIEANITAGTYTLGSAANTTAIGFPAIDYLLYFGGDAAVIADFTTNALAANRKNYLVSLVAKMKDEFQPVLTDWTGSYKATFIASDGNDAGSSCSYLLNEFVKDLEILKNARIGIPAGQQTGGMPMPEYVEAYYSGYSNLFAYNHLWGLRTAFSGGNGSGFDDYIRDVESEDVTVSLADNIQTQFDVCIAKVDALGSALSNEVQANPAAVSELYQEIKKLLVYCKTDMTSMLGILITYQDNDGD